MEQKTKKWLIIAVVVVGAIILLSVLFGKNCNLGGSKYDVLSEDVTFTYYGLTASPKATVKAKNTSNGTISISFQANIYCDGELFDSVLSEVLTLESGDVGIFTAVSTKETYVYHISTKSWTVKITKWNMY